MFILHPNKNKGPNYFEQTAFPKYFYSADVFSPLKLCHVTYLALEASCRVSFAVHSSIPSHALTVCVRSGTMLAEPQEKDTAHCSWSKRAKAACLLPMERSCTGPRCSSSWPSCPPSAGTSWSSWLCRWSANSKMPLTTSSCL